MVKTNLKVKFGRRLRQIRRLKNLTQEQLAEATGISVEFVSNIERGINAPSFDTLEKLTEVLNVSCVDLFDFPDE
ncbi:MAG: helix-turn-helix transcriptional regulator [Dolichospermum circinale Clear-D4]|nr:helix-turn-helix transcriptional regulator [Dolichospermum circinale Clear-D4]